MATLGALLKQEITRLSRRELRRELEPIKKASATHRRHIAALKRQVVKLERQVVAMSRGGRKTQVPAAEGTALRFVAKGLRALRVRLDLSAAELGKLAGVSGQSIYNWENKKATPRRSQVAILAGLRALGKREARARLDQLSAKKPTKPRKPVRRG